MNETETIQPQKVAYITIGQRRKIKLVYSLDYGDEPVPGTCSVELMRGTEGGKESHANQCKDVMLETMDVLREVLPFDVWALRREPRDREV